MGNQHPGTEGLVIQKKGSLRLFTQMQLVSESRESAWEDVADRDDYADSSRKTARADSSCPQTSLE